MTIHLNHLLKLSATLALSATLTTIAQAQAPASNIAPLAATAPTVVPALVPYSGLALDHEGRALTGEIGVTFLIFKDQAGGEPLFTETHTVAPDPTGHYTVRLGANMTSGLPLDLFSSGEARWLEIQTAGQKPQARVLLMSVPYALKAADAATLGGLPASAFALANSKSPVNPASTVPTPLVTNAVTNATSTVTTTGGTANNLAKFSGASTIVNSVLYDNGTQVGIGTTSPTATLTVNGAATVGGQLLVPAQGTATTATAYSSHAFELTASAYNSSTKAVVAPRFQLVGEATGNNTTTPKGTLNVLSSTTSANPTETGLYINTNGTIHFASGQTFPGVPSAGGAFCIAVGGGFGSGGTTFIAPALVTPAAGNCSPWSGFTKTAGTVIATTSGAACLSSDSKALTVSVSSADPSFFGAGTVASDYIALTRTGTSGTFPSGSDQGYFSGTADQITCTSTLLQLPSTHD